jgi:hypothetical protein
VVCVRQPLLEPVINVKQDSTSRTMFVSLGLLPVQLESTSRLVLLVVCPARIAAIPLTVQSVTLSFQPSAPSVTPISPSTPQELVSRPLFAVLLSSYSQPPPEESVLTALPLLCSVKPV